MQLNVTGHHLEITDAMHDYVTSKLARLKQHFDHVIHTHVILSVEKERQKAEATVHVSGKELFAEAENGNLYAAIDELADKLDRQIRKHKEKRTDHHRSKGAERKQQDVFEQP